MKQYEEKFEIEYNGIKFLYIIKARDYDEAMEKLYDHLKTKNIFHCYKNKVSFSIQYLGEEEIEEYEG